jgi:hypothetical protein
MGRVPHVLVNSKREVQIRKEVIDARCAHNDDRARVDERGVWCSDEDRVAAILSGTASV